MKLANRAYVVTGGGRGLGRAYALAVAEAGGAVVVNDVDGDPAEEVAAEIRALGGRSAAHVGSVSEWDAAADLMDLCLDTFGSLDGLVNNAGIFYGGPAGENSEEEIREIVEVNVVGSIFAGTHALTRMKKQGHGVVVNVTSGAALGVPTMSAYGGTKGATMAMTFGWALDTKPLGLRVNAISPFGRTRMADHSPLDTSAFPEPATIAPVVVYLLSDDAEFTGQVLRLDGRRLSVLEHPTFSAGIEREVWTTEDIASVVAAGDLAITDWAPTIS